MRTQLYSILIALAPLLAGCSREQEAHLPQPGILVEVGDRVIDIEDLQNEWSRSPQAEDPKQVLERLVERALLLEYAEREGIADDPEIQRAVENLLIGKCKELLLAREESAGRVTDEAVAAHYQTHQQEYTSPERIRLAMVVLKGAPKMSDRRRQEMVARVLEAEKLAATSFRKAAADYSDDQATRYRGGDLGWLTPGKLERRLPAAVAGAALALRDSDVPSQAIASGNDHYILRLLDHEPESPLPLLEVQSRIRAKLASQRRGDNVAAVTRTLHAAIKVRHHTETLEGIPFDRHDLASTPNLPAIR